MEEIDINNLEIPSTIKPVEIKEQKVSRQRKKKVVTDDYDDELVSCLRNERIIVRFIPRTGGIWNNTTNPRHVLSGGMSNNSFVRFTVPRLRTGNYVNVLTNDEKRFLENYMGLEDDTMSVYKRQFNFWDDSNEEGINTVYLNKGDNFFDLSSPDDYIRYKILLANKDVIAPSLQDLEDHPKATYRFVVIDENAEAVKLDKNVSITMQCYKEFGKIEDDSYKMCLILEIINNRPIDENSKVEYLRTKINEAIQSNPKNFYRIVTDNLLDTKVLIKKSLLAGNIYLKGDYYYLKEDNTPLCGKNEEPTLNNAARFLNLPKNQQIKFMLEAKLKEQ